MQAADIVLIGLPYRPRDKQNSRMADAVGADESAVEKKVVCRSAHPGADGRECWSGRRAREAAKNGYCRRKMPSRQP